MRRPISTAIYFIMFLIGLANTLMFAYFTLDSVEPLYRRGLHITLFSIAVTFTFIMWSFLKDINGWSRLAHWLLIALVYTLVYPPCLVWNLLTLPMWFNTYRGNRWYHFHASGAVEWMGETRFIKHVSRLDSTLEMRITYGQHYKA